MALCRVTAASSARRCALCHDRLRGPTLVHAHCARCDTVVHEACGAELQDSPRALCPTLGCGVFQPAPPPRWLAALDLALCAGLILGGLALVLRLALGGLYGSVLVMQHGAFSGL